MTACSGNRPKMNKKTSVVKAEKKVLPQQVPTQQVEPTIRQRVQKRQVSPVVYEKRHPRVRRITQNRRSTYRRSPVVRNYSFASKLSNAALTRLNSRVRYDGSYVKIAYPWGDVPPNIGVCTDVVIRSYRKLGIDLQQQVHNDISAAFSAYPNIKKWGLSKPDPNIDHRRVYNLRVFFTRRGAALPVTHNPRDYRPGDLVTWMVGKDLPHIGVVVNRRSKADPNRYMIVHNIAYGPQLDDILFRFPITGHYRYTPANMHNIPKPSFVSRRPVQKKTNSMDYSQLVAAAKILGTDAPKSKSKKKVSGRVNEIDPITLATLSDTEIQNLFK